MLFRKFLKIFEIKSGFLPAGRSRATNQVVKSDFKPKRLKILKQKFQ